MNMLTVATIDFVNHLRAATVGWRIEPVLLSGPIKTNDQIIDIIKPPPNISFTNFFVNYTPKADQQVNGEQIHQIFPAIRIRVEKHRLTYFIQCGITIDRKPMLELSYWRGTGWLQTKKPVPGLGRYRRSSIRFRDHECSKDKISYHVYKIDRVKKGAKRRGTKRPGTPNIVYQDRVDLSDPNAAHTVATRTIWTLTRAMKIALDDNCSTHHVYVYTDDNAEEITETHTWKSTETRYAD